jgi:hypothetical protein
MSTPTSLHRFALLQADGMQSLQALTTQDPEALRAVAEALHAHPENKDQDASTNVRVLTAMMLRTVAKMHELLAEEQRAADADEAP